MNLFPRKFYLDDIFDDLIVPERSNSMKCDIYEKDGKYNIEMDIPGFKKEDIKINSDKGYLTITAEKSVDNDDSEDKKYIRRERSYTKYERSFYLGDASEEDIDASFKDGTLYIVIPKKDANQDKKFIEIK